MKQARQRTESMVQRFSKKPISEGYDLWDRGYPLGALRLFIFKSESAPPFQMGPCLDATAEISLQMDGRDDALEHFQLAADKYQLIQQAALAELMRVKAVEVQEGAAAALARMLAYLAETDPATNGGGAAADAKKRAGLARCYAYLAELHLQTCTDGDDATTMAANTERAHRAVSAAQLAVQLGWDRAHCGYLVLGEAYDLLQDLPNATAAYQAAVKTNPKYVEGLEHLVDVLKRGQADIATVVMPVLNQAIEAHPKAELYREKTFLMCEVEGDESALRFLDELIAHPPVEEGESVDATGGRTLCTLYKAKAAVLADGGKFAEALVCAEKALAARPRDEEAQAMLDDIKESAAGL